MHEVAARCAAYLLELDGWRTVTLGMNTPFFSFADAAADYGFLELTVRY